MFRKSISGSADGADHHVEVASSFTRQAGAITRGESHLLGLAVGVGDEGASSGLHDGNSTCGGSGGNAQSGIGLAETVQAAVLQHGSVAGEQCVGDVTQNDLAITQASSHFAVGVHTTVGGGQAGVLAADACNGVRDDAAGVGGDGVHSVKALVAVCDERLQRGKLASANEGAAGVGRDGLPGECVEHG